jgi:methylenetetrahydrofolate/methylenetetrahydromethanopterin dehydrogenase (NADP+)
MKRILIQLDTDLLPSSFDRVVAVDAGVDELFAYGAVTPENVVPLVHGAIFTRGPDQLSNTAIFIGGSNVDAGEELLQAVSETFFGPMRVSVMMDSNGSNTTAAAAVRVAGRHLDLSQSTALVLGGTGPVGQRAAEMLARKGTTVKVSSRSVDRALQTCERIARRVPGVGLSPVESTAEQLQAALEDVQVLLAAGAAGVQFLSVDQWQSADSLRVAIDVNAVPPVGLEGLGVTNKAQQVGNVVTYGAIGVGGTKMKVHKAAIETLFESNSAVLDTAAIAAIADELT